MEVRSPSACLATAAPMGPSMSVVGSSFSRISGYGASAASRRTMGAPPSRRIIVTLSTHSAPRGWNDARLSAS
eukprot:5949701-Prymnesium_polylepis.1